jgi:ribosome-associated protein
VVRDASAVDGVSGLDLGRGVIVPLEEVELRASRSSGPGGQHANVTASRVEAVFDVRASRSLSEADRARLIERLGPRVTAVAQDARGQARNRELALERLRQKLAEGLRMRRPRRATSPTAASRERRLEGKRVAGARKAARRPPQPGED